jgi:hypothetical protein
MSGRLEPAAGATGAALQACYVVVGTGWDRHAQMAWLSAQSVRIQEPRVRVVVIAEGRSPAACEELSSRFSGVADVLFKTAEVADPVLKSRFHRIALREYLAGDVLYLDSDTLAIAPFADVLDYPGDVGAVIDFNDPPDRAWCPPDLEAPFHRLGWTYPIPRYRNAGVALFRDTPGAFSFCREWMARWQRPAAGASHTWDQATFNSALVDSGAADVVLPNGYNAMVAKPNYRFRESRILHFFGSVDEQRGTLMEHMLQRLQQTGTFDRPAYDRSIRQGHPWGPSPTAWQLRRSRNYIRAALTKARAAWRRADPQA